MGYLCYVQNSVFIPMVCIPMVCIPMVCIPMLCILWYVYLWYVYLWYVYLWYVYLWYGVYSGYTVMNTQVINILLVYYERTKICVEFFLEYILACILLKI